MPAAYRVFSVDFLMEYRIGSTKNPLSNRLKFQIVVLVLVVLVT